MGLDLAAANSGVCVIEAQFPDYCFNVVLEEALHHPKDSFINRSDATDYIMYLIMEHKVDVVSMEDYARRFGHTNTSGFEYGEIGGMVRKALYDAGIPFYVVPPTSMRSFMGVPPKSPKDFLETQALNRLGYSSIASTKKKRSDITDAFIHAHIGSLIHILRNDTLSYNMTDAEKRIMLGDGKIIGLKDRKEIYHATKEE
jgi:hypothetical protein